MIRSTFRIAEAPATVSVARAPETVIAQRYFYVVDLGSQAQPRYHHVDHLGVCTCPRQAQCPASQVIDHYWSQGGEALEAPPEGYNPLRPAACPRCGAETQFDPGLGSKVRGAGWRCVEGGSAHYWATMGKALAILHRENPWLFPPVQDEDGTLRYPGLLRSDICS